LIKVQVGGCQVPGLKDAPDPVGSEDLKAKFYQHITINKVMTICGLEVRTICLYYSSRFM